MRQSRPGNHGCTTLTALGNSYHGRWQHANFMPGRAALVAGAQRTSQPPQSSRRGQNLLKDSTREQSLRQMCARRFACEADAR